MLRGYNILPYYESKSLQKWSDMDNIDNVFIFATNISTPFFLISDNEVYSATVQIFDAQTDEAIGDEYELTVDSYSIKHLGATLTDCECGYYYQKIVTDSDTYYSEVFRWDDDVSEFLKITATSSNITIGDTEELDLSDITYSCYVEAEDSVYEPEIKEEGSDEPRGDIPIFNTLNIIRGFDVFASKPMIRFLFGLRILETNGTVTYTFNGDVMESYDNQIEKGDVIGNDTALMINIRFKLTDYISSRNEI